MELVPIGTVESTLVDRAAAPKQGHEGAPDAWLVLDAKLADGLLDRAGRALDPAALRRVRCKSDLMDRVLIAGQQKFPDRCVHKCVVHIVHFENFQMYMAA